MEKIEIPTMEEQIVKVAGLAKLAKLTCFRDVLLKM